MRRWWMLSMFLLLAVPMSANNDSIPRKASLPRRIIGTLYAFVKEFSKLDTNYVEPQHYNFTVMLQNTNTYEMYRLESRSGHSITFTPKPTIKLGPYFGWRWVFLGYTLDLTHLHGGNNKREFDLSLYSSQIGIDLFYRKTGNDYRIRRMNLGDDIDTSPLHKVNFDGISASIKGFNLYYIFNHRKFSYPAAFSQSTVQRRSCGSPLVGIGYTRHTLNVDWNKLNAVVSEHLNQDIALSRLDSSLTFGKIRYTDVSFSGGYGYNWVFAHNWLFASSLSLAIAYKHTSSETQRQHFSLKDFTLDNINLDGVGRFGIVWNNTRWYFGANAIFHSYNYRKKQFSTNNVFGNVNIYVGFNFDRR